MTKPANFELVTYHYDDGYGPVSKVQYYGDMLEKFRELWADPTVESIVVNRITTESTLNLDRINGGNRE